jgi:hypothetical protein
MMNRKDPNSIADFLTKDACGKIEHVERVMVDGKPISKAMLRKVNKIIKNRLAASPGGCSEG